MESVSGKTLESGVEQTLPGPRNGIRVGTTLPEPPPIRFNHASNYLHAFGNASRKIRGLPRDDQR
jgi:hypothetical protein